MCFTYDLFLNLEGNPPVNHLRCEKLTFNNPTTEFRYKLLMAGGVSVTRCGPPVWPSSCHACPGCSAGSWAGMCECSPHSCCPAELGGPRGSPASAGRWQLWMRSLGAGCPGISWAAVGN